MDFRLTSANDGTFLIRPVSAKGEVFWKENNLYRFVCDNKSEYYVIRSENQHEICDLIRENDMDFDN